MGKIICEVCGASDFVKANDLFECQNCGTKYTAEHLRTLMSAVSNVSLDASPPTPPRGAAHYIELAQKEFDAGNYAAAEKYASQAAEADPRSSESWYIKGLAVGEQSTLQEFRIAEVVSYFAEAIQLKEGDADGMSFVVQTANDIRSMVMRHMSIAAEAFVASNGDVGEAEMCYDMQFFSETIKQLGFYDGRIVEGEPWYDPAWLECGVEMAKVVEDAALRMIAKADNIWSTLPYPSTDDLMAFVASLRPVESLLEAATNTFSAIEPINHRALIVIYTARRDLYRSWGNRQTYTAYWGEFTGTMYSKNRVLSSEELLANGQRQFNKLRYLIDVSECALSVEEDVAKETRRQILDAHPKAKAHLLTQLRQSESEREGLRANLGSLRTELSNQYAEHDAKKSDEDKEYEDIQAKIESVTNERSQLGFLDIKRKRQIDRELAALRSAAEEKSRAAREISRMRRQELEKQLGPKYTEIDTLSKQVDSLDKEIASTKQILDGALVYPIPDDLL